MNPRTQPWWLDFIPPILFVLLLSLTGPWWSVYEFNRDEGYNLMKAALLLEGYSMYTEIWSDQPPGLTYMLAPLIKIFGFEILPARILILFFSCLTVGLLFRIIRRLEGLPVAWVAAACLGFEFNYSLVSVSIMIGLPAISLAVVSLALLLEKPGRPGRLLLWLSAAAMALSLQTKLFTTIMLPMIVLALFLGPGEKEGDDLQWRPGSWKPALEWALVLLLCFFLMMWLTNQNPLRDIIGPHWVARTTLWQDHPGWRKIPLNMVGDYYYLFFISAGLLLSRPLKRKSVWLPVSWCVMSLAVLGPHKPIWYHHVIMVTLPLSWLCGYAARMIFPGWFRNGWQRPLDWRVPTPRQAEWGQVLLVAAVISVIPGHIALHNQWREPSVEDQQAAPLVRQYAEQTRWMITDRQIDAFYNKILVPPPLAVYSHKRLKSKILKGEEIVEYLKEYRPEQVSFRRLGIPKPVKKYLKKHYIRIPSFRKHRFYVLPHLIKNDPPPPDN